MNSKFLSILLPTTLAGAVLLSLVDAAAKSFVLLGLAVVLCLALLRASGVDPSEAMNGAWAGLGVIQLLTVLGIGAVLPTVLLIVWGVGAVFLLCPMVRSAWTLHRLAASLGVVTDGPVAGATGEIA